MNLEHLINQLVVFDNKNDSVFFLKHEIQQDITLSSHGGMSSFLQDFDLRDDSQWGGPRPDTHYRTQQTAGLLGAFADEESRIYVDSPLKGANGSRASM